jgi:hypothetical protein
MEQCAVVLDEGAAHAANIAGTAAQAEAPEA